MSESEYILSNVKGVSISFSFLRRCQAPRFFKQLSKLKISLLVVDVGVLYCSGDMTLEAITYLLQDEKEFGSPRTLALTATATTQVIHDIYTFLD